MKRFKLIEHTADTGVLAYGNNLAEAFASAAFGLFSIITELGRVREAESRKVEVNSVDVEELLFEWLNHLIYTFDVDLLLFKRFDITDFSENRLEAICYGEKYDPSRHKLNLGVKSATYHLLRVDKEKNQVQVIFDV